MLMKKSNFEFLAKDFLNVANITKVQNVRILVLIF